MISREEKNKNVVKEIQKERTIEISKKIFKLISITLIMLFLLFGYTYFIGVKGLITNEYVIKDNLIPESFHGVKVLHFSDLLYGSTIDNDYIVKLEEEIKKINPDIVFFTGNLVDANHQESSEDIKLLNTFFQNIPYKIGKYAVKGNQDNHSFDVIFDNTDFIILNDEIVTIYNNSQDSINIVGLNNSSQTINIEKDNYTISLINNYDNYEKYHIKSNLILSGYNLGGEIKIFNIPLIKKTSHMENHFFDNDTEVFVSNGLGSIHHMRLFNHPSINIYRLLQNKNN